MNMNVRPLFVGLLVVLFSGCLSPHENFKLCMGANVGRKINGSDRSHWAIPEYFVGSKSLPNGNIENEYKYIRTCRYFFEYDPETRIIVNWRFEGKESDCVVNP